MKIGVTLLGVTASFLLLFCSCTSENENDPEQSSVLLKQLQYTVMADHAAYDFYYKGQKIDSIVYQFELPFKAYDKYVYSGDFITEIRTYDHGGHIIEKTIFFYNTIGQLTEEVTLYLDRNTATKNVFTYTGNASVEVRNFHGDLNTQTNYRHTEVFHLENGEISLIEYNVGTPSLYTRQFEYDQGNNPLRNVIGLDKIKWCEYMSDGLYGLTRNIQTTTTHFFSEEIQDSPLVFEIVYNDENYPVSAVSTVDSPGGFNYQYRYYE
ncbi:hypothetical protein [Flavobacterium pedocola]